MTRVLIVDDEPQILRAMRINLRARGYEVVVAATGTDALSAAASSPPDIVILDLGLPDMDGVDVIHGLRGWTRVPIVVLSGRVESWDKVSALDAGADDYITKPFGIDELLARLRAVARRTGEQAASPIVRFGHVTVDLAAHRATRALPLGREAGDVVDGEGADGSGGPVEEIHLTKTEWGLLRVLLSHPGKLVTQRQLLTEVWGARYETETHYLRTYLNRLRQKLEDDPARPHHLLTEPGMGYRFQP